MILRKCGKFLADGSGENEMSLWSVLTNTHKPPEPYDCPNMIRRGSRRFMRSVVIDEVVPEGRRPQTKPPSMLTRLYRLARFGLWGKKPSEPRYQPPPYRPPPPRPLPPPPQYEPQPYEPPQYEQPPYEPPPYEAPPPPSTQPVVKQRGPGRLKRLMTRLVKKRNLFLSMPLLFVLPVVTFFLLRATYKRFFRRFKKRHRTRVRYTFIGAIFCSFFFTVYEVLLIFYEIIFKD